MKKSFSWHVYTYMRRVNTKIFVWQMFSSRIMHKVYIHTHTPHEGNLSVCFNMLDILRSCALIRHFVWKKVFADTCTQTCVVWQMFSCRFMHELEIHTHTPKISNSVCLFWRAWRIYMRSSAFMRQIVWKEPFWRMYTNMRRVDANQNLWQMFFSRIIHKVSIHTHTPYKENLAVCSLMLDILMSCAFTSIHETFCMKKSFSWHMYTNMRRVNRKIFLWPMFFSRIMHKVYTHTHTENKENLCVCFLVLDIFEVVCIN